ncbi:MAG: recombinase family protein [Waterburya sp.]
MSLLKETGCEEIFEEKISGAKKTRPELEKLLSQIRASDTLVVCKLDRLARSTHHLLEIVETLREKKATFCSLGEPWADTTYHAGKMIRPLAKVFYGKIKGYLLYFLPIILIKYQSGAIAASG